MQQARAHVVVERNQAFREFAAGLHVEPTTAALLSTAFTLPYALVQPLLGALADVFSKAKLVAICMVIGGLTSMACGLVSDYETLFGLRVFAGMTSGGTFPIVFALVGDRVPVSERQVAFSKLLFAAMTGNLLGASGAGVIGDLIGWRGVFVATGSFALLTTAIAAPRLLAIQPRRVTSPGHGSASRRQQRPR